MAWDRAAEELGLVTLRTGPNSSAGPVPTSQCDWSQSFNGPENCSLIKAVNLKNVTKNVKNVFKT